MGRRVIKSLWNRDNLLDLNENFVELYEDIRNSYSISAGFLSEAQNVLENAKKYNLENQDVKRQLDNIVLESGDSNAEVAQARSTFSTLNARLDNEFQRLMDSEAKANRAVIATSKRKFPMLTFIDDDGRTELKQKWEPILKEKKNKLTVALVTSWVDNEAPTVIHWDEIHRWKEEYGVEFVSHTHTHQRANSLTPIQVEDELSQAKAILKREGLTHDIIVQPFGENTEDVRRISRDYAKANFGIKEFVNQTPFDTFNAKRISLADSFNNTWEDYKKVLDEAIATNGWVVFKSHSQYTSFDSNQIELIKKIIDYARTNGIVNVDLEEGLQYFGNIIDLGDYTAREQAGVHYYVLDRDGKVYSNTNSKDFWAYKYNSVDFNTPVTFFEPNTTSTTTIVSSASSPFPTTKPGTLITFRGDSITLSYQLYIPSINDQIYKRRWDDTAQGWTSFKKIVTDNVEYFTRHYTSTIKINANSTYDVDISNAVLTSLGFKAGDLIYGSPEIKLPDGVIYNVMIVTDNTITVRYANTTSSPINVNATNFNFKISRVK